MVTVWQIVKSKVCDGQPIVNLQGSYNPQAPATCEYGQELNCNDGEDNDANGLTDCNDPICVANEPQTCAGGGGTGQTEDCGYCDR